MYMSVFYMKKFILFILLFTFWSPAVYSETRYYRFGGSYYTTFPSDSSYTSCDPFYMKIDGNNYYMFVDDGNPITYQNILGCSWPKSSLFEPLRLLDKNRDEKLTQSELRNGNIRLVRLKIGRQLGIENPELDYNLDNIAYIDLKWLRVDAVGVPRGSFDVYLYPDKKTNKKIIGRTSALEVHFAKRMLGY